MEQKKSYYAIIPANVRYDKKLTPNAKLLYGEITALCNQEGYCWAGDSYFMELYQVKRSSIQRWMNQLEKSNYIHREVKYKDGTKEIEQRRVYIQDTLYPKLGIPYTQKRDNPIPKKETDNNTSNNTNNIYSAFFEKAWGLYPHKVGKGKISDTKKREIHQLGEEFERCISRYIKYVEVERKKGFKELKYQNGSTFFNSGYVDYLDKNFEDKVVEKRGPLTLVIRDSY